MRLKRRRAHIAIYIVNGENRKTGRTDERIAASFYAPTVGRLHNNAQYVTDESRIVVHGTTAIRRETE